MSGGELVLTAQHEHVRVLTLHRPGALNAVGDELATALEGKRIRVEGYMAPPLKAESTFFVLTKRPMAVCPTIISRCRRHRQDEPGPSAAMKNSKKRLSCPAFASIATGRPDTSRESAGAGRAKA